MSTINFTCPHCSHTTELASSTEGMKGNCPSCKTEVVITPDITESDWLVMSSGLKSETPTKLKDSEIIALIRDSTIGGGAQLSNLSELAGQWIDLKDSHFYQYVEEVNVQKQQIHEQAKADKIEVKEAQRRNKTKIREDCKQQKMLAIDAKNKEEQDGESIPISNLPKVIGGLSVVAFFLGAGYFIRSWATTNNGPATMMQSLSNFFGALNIWIVVIGFAGTFALCCWFHHIYETK